MPLYDVVILDVDDTGGKEKGTIIEVGLAKERKAAKELAHG